MHATAAGDDQTLQGWLPLASCCMPGLCHVCLVTHAPLQTFITGASQRHWSCSISMNAYIPYLDIYSITLACMLCASNTVTLSCCDLLCLPARCQRCRSWLNYSCVDQHLKHVSQAVICCHWLDIPSWLQHASYTSPLCVLLWCIHVQKLSMTVYALCKL